jgi:hypothetical protein
MCSVLDVTVLLPKQRACFDLEMYGVVFIFCDTVSRSDTHVSQWSCL